MPDKKQAPAVKTTRGTRRPVSLTSLAKALTAEIKGSGLDETSTIGELFDYLKDKVYQEAINT